MDEYVKRLLEPDAREEKQAAWLRQSLRELRRELERQHNEVQRLRDEIPAHSSDMLVKSYDRLGDRHAGLGRRAHVVVPLGDRRRSDGSPVWYVEMSAGYEHDGEFGRSMHEDKGPVVCAKVRGSSGVIIMPDVSNSFSVYVADHVRADGVKLR